MSILLSDLSKFEQVHGRSPVVSWVLSRRVPASARRRTFELTVHARETSHVVTWTGVCLECMPIEGFSCRGFNLDLANRFSGGVFGFLACLPYHFQARVCTVCLAIQVFSAGKNASC
jgi:hypothetical protein